MKWLPNLFGEVWDKPLSSLEEFGLDAGESACINIALAHSDSVLLMKDELAGRAVAKEKGVLIIGTAAIISHAKKEGFNFVCA